MLDGNRPWPQTRHLEPKNCCLGMNHKLAVTDGDLFLYLYPFVWTVACAGQRKRKNLQAFAGVLTCRGQFVEGWKWISLLLVALIFTSIHFVTVIIDFPVNVMEKNINLRAHRLPWDFNCWCTHQCWVKIPFPAYSPSHTFCGWRVWWACLLGALKALCPLSAAKNNRWKKRQKEETMKIEIERRRREKERKRKRHKNRQIVNCWVCRSCSTAQYQSVSHIPLSQRYSYVDPKLLGSCGRVRPDSRHGVNPLIQTEEESCPVQTHRSW